MNINNQKELLRTASFVLEKEIESIGDLSDNQLLFFSSLSHMELNRCFAIQEVLNGRSFRQVSVKYGISKSRLEVLCKR